MQSLDEIRAVKQGLIREWSESRLGGWNSAPITEASLDALELPGLATAGFAVGHSVDAATGASKSISG